MLIKIQKKSSADSFNIHEIDEMGYINTDSLGHMEVHELGDQSQATNDAPTTNIYSEASAPTINKKSKHEHLEGMTGMLRGGMDNLAGAINWLSSLPPISETEIWNMLEELDLESGADTNAYIFLCQNASACCILIGCPKEQHKNRLSQMMPNDN
ncbi:hypothetical protein FXO38_03986 [Capsicum annuum]|nr:hypothetical protein FXO37_12448 [Capsicum annuum]KAF3677074.1 hypothetical protein FXO38_03986 [Capsicum annuum]